MKLIKITISIFTVLLTVSSVQAQQGKTSLGIRYTVGIPMGSLKNNISNTSFRGLQADVLYGISDKISIGLGTGYQDFYQKVPRQVYKLTDGSDISAVLSYSIQTIPVMAAAKYQFNPGSAIQPYAAVGVGGNIISYSELLGEFGGSQVKFGFAARPELGVYVPFRSGGESGFSIAASYNIMPFNQGSFQNLNHVGVSAGITIPLKD